MKESKLDRELNAFVKEQRNSEVPSAFSKGIDHALAKLPVSENRSLQKKKKSWLYAVAATGFLGAGILGSGFASPAMAEMLTKVPGLDFIFSAVYKDVSKEKEDLHLLRGSGFGYGEDNNAFNTAGGDIEVKMFYDYTEEVENYLGMKIPHLDRNADHLTIKVDKHGENQFEILEMGYLNGEDVIFSVVPYAVNSPKFEGDSVRPIIQSAVDINGVKADVLSYQFSLTDKENRTNYITWKRNKFTFVLGGTQSIDKLTSFAKNLDEQAINLEKN